MRNGSDRELNPQPQRWQALMLTSNIDLTTAPLWQPNTQLILSCCLSYAVNRKSILLKKKCCMPNLTFFSHVPPTDTFQLVFSTSQPWSQCHTCGLLDAEIQVQLRMRIKVFCSRFAILNSFKIYLCGLWKCCPTPAVYSLHNSSKMIFVE
jgi:hypothetical protein